MPGACRYANLRLLKIGLGTSVVLHDIRLYAERHPEVKDYASILQKNGIERDMEKMKTADVNCVNTECIMVAACCSLSHGSFGR